ncbi:MAG TPA: class F sortase [Trebonia sp.]
MTYRRYHGEGQAPQGISPLVIFVVGLAMLLIGGLVVARSITGADKLPPAAAQQIPATVGTAAPFPVNAAAVGPPLAASAPVRIVIPAIGVRAPVMRLGRSSDGTVQVPPLDDHNLAGWYDGSVTPGQRGSSVILGHVDDYAGPSVFFAIKTLVRGVKIDVIRADGVAVAFAVDGVQKIAKPLFPASTVYGNAPYPSLRLVTCGGPFDASNGQYRDNIVVYAHLIGVVARPAD